MKSKEYWEDAALLREIAVQDEAAYTAEEILKLYDEALNDIEDEIRKIEYNFQKRFGVDNTTAQYFLTQAQEDANTQYLLEALMQAPTEQAREDILTYIQLDGLSARAYSARRERFRAVEKEIYARIKLIAAKGIPMTAVMLKSAYKESYYGMIDDTAQGLDMGISFSMLNDDAIEAAVNAKWSGSRFSERIWNNTDKLAKDAQDIVIKHLMSGRSLNKAAQVLEERFEVSKFHATTLIHTETAHIHKEADFKAYRDLGIKKYKYLAALDYRTCPYCQPLDNMVFNVSEAREGVNCPVMHPRCRCVTVMDTDFTKRTAREPISDKNINVDGSLTYKEWFDGLNSQQKQAFEQRRKMSINKSKDKLMHEKYKAALGTKTVPGSFDKWREIVYTDTKRYEELKSLYRGVNNGTVIKNAGGQYIKKVQHAGLIEKPNSILQIETKKGGINRNYYDNNGRQIKQISNNGHGHKKENSFGKHGEHAHDYVYSENGKLIRVLRELTQDERKENSDIL